MSASLVVLSFTLTALPLSNTAQRFPAQWTPPKPRPEVRLLLDQAERAFEQHRWEEALRLCGEAQSQATMLRDRAGEAIVLHDLGYFYSNTGQPQKALEYYQQALPLRREV